MRVGGLVKIIEVDSPDDILARRAEFPEEDLILSRGSPRSLLHRGKAIELGLFDWDFTLTDVRSQWHAVQVAHLTGTLADDEDRDRDFYYGGKPTWGNESPFPENDWWMANAESRDLSSEQAAYGTRTIMRWAQAGITRKQLRAVGAKITLREGVADVFAAIAQRFVISFGIEELIEASLHANALDARVVANRLFYDARGRIRSHHPHVVVNATKKKIAHAALKRERVLPEQVLCIGDSIGDIEMAPDGALSILYLPRTAVDRQIGNWRQGQLPELWPKVRCVIVSDTFAPVLELVRRF